MTPLSETALHAQELAQHAHEFWLQFGLQLFYVGVVALGFGLSIWQFRSQTKTQLLALYSQVFLMVDGIRSDRHYIASANFARSTKDAPAIDTYIAECWLDPAALASHPDWADHRASAERVFRAFDQLGLLIREGRVPLNAITRFYVRPILEAWYKLGPYIKAVRDKKDQPSHGWEFENLVYDIILPNLKLNRGLWEGVQGHDFPHGAATTWLNVLISEGPDPQGDTTYKPPKNIWIAPR